jgi:Homing endonuclease associated repeat
MLSKGRVRFMAKNGMAKEESSKEKILAAIRRAAEELGRAPSRGELRRITGVSHYRVLAEFPTLREAVRAAGLEPNPKGEKISTEDLLADWKRVAEKLGRRPSRAEYVREGKYSAGALTVRFGSWGKISATEATEEHTEGKSIHRGGAETRRKKELPKPEERNHKGHPFDSSFASSESLRAGYGTQRESGLAKPARAVKPGESVLHNFDRVPLAPVPTPVVGMRRVTEAVAQMVVNTLMGSGYWPMAIGSWPEGAQPSAFSVQPRANPFTTEATEKHGGEYGRELTRRTRIRAADAPRGICREGDLGPSLAVNAPLVQDDDLMRRDLARRGVKNDRPVMGEPFDRSPMTNAPVNELGVMVLFGMVAAGLGLQVESVQGKFPDCLAKRQVAPGKWQHLRIEFEYESKNFKLHGHDPKGCDMIVCWRHNWKDVPANIEVIELCRLIG